MTHGATERKLSFEEFKLYYESTEKVTDRRLETNRWNYSICIAMLVAIGVLTKWSLTSATLLWIGFAAVAVLSGMALLFCFLWVRQIRDFKALNDAKFKVLNAMAPNLEFDTDKPDIVVSYCPFEKEWDILKEGNRLERVRGMNIEALKASNIEYFIPKAFIVLFVAIFAVLVAVIVSDWPPTKLVQPSSPASASSSQGQTH
jgi:hypothetical protein